MSEKHHEIEYPPEVEMFIHDYGRFYLCRSILQYVFVGLPNGKIFEYANSLQLIYQLILCGRHRNYHAPLTLIKSSPQT